MFETPVTVLDVFFNHFLHSFPPVSSLDLPVSVLPLLCPQVAGLSWQASKIPGTLPQVNASTSPQHKLPIFTLNNFTSLLKFTF